MKTDDVFELLVAANPVPDPDTWPTALARSASPGHRSTPMLTLERSSNETGEQRPNRYRWLAVAAAVVAIVAVVAAVVNRDDANPIEPSTPVVTTGDSLPDPPTREERAIATTAEFLAAINAGDVATAVAMSNPQFVDLVPARQMWEMNAATADRYGTFQDVGACEPSDVNSLFVEVECDVVVADPVFHALGVAELIAPARVFDDQSVVWLAWRGADFTVVNAAVREYLQERHPTEFDAVCAPSAYEPGSVIVNNGIALTGPCGELAAPLADDIAAWITDRG